MNAESPRVRSLLERRTVSESYAPIEKDDVAEYTAYANGRLGNRPQLTLVFRKADGSVKAFAYSHLYAVSSDDPAAGFTVEFSKLMVTVRGENLDPLFRLVCQHRVLEISEISRNQVFDMVESEPTVQKIDYRTF